MMARFHTQPMGRHMITWRFEMDRAIWWRMDFSCCKLGGTKWFLHLHMQSQYVHYMHCFPLAIFQLMTNTRTSTWTFQISNHKTWQDKGDENLWLFKLQGYKQSEVYNTTWAAKNGHLETLKWIRANGGEWRYNAANWAAYNGHLETLKWIRANGGGEWTICAANWAAENGHLETLKWIHANGGKWTSDAANDAANNGHLETLKWIRANGGEWTSYAVDGAARNGHLEILKWIRANGGKWTSYAASEAAKNGHLETLKWIHAKWRDFYAADRAAQLITWKLK